MTDFDVSSALQAAVNGPENTAEDVAPEPVRAAPPGEVKIAALEGGLPSEKAKIVAATADAKRVALGGLPDQQTYMNAAVTRKTGAGLSSSNEIERDHATLPYDVLREKYGQESVSNLIAAEREYSGLAGNYRSGSAAAYDSFSKASADMFDMAGGAAAWGLGGIDAGINAIGGKSHMGLWAARKTKEIVDDENSTQSAAIQLEERAQAEKANLEGRDNFDQFDQDKLKDGKFLAGLKYIGRGAADGFTDLASNPRLLGHSAAGFAGAMLGGVVLGEGAGLVAKVPGVAGAWSGAERAGYGALSKGMVALNEAGAPKAAAMLEKYATKAAAVAVPGEAGVVGAAMFGGGSYKEVANEVLNTPPDELDASSPYYHDLIKKGVDPDEALNQTAQHAAMIAAAFAAPAGVVGGKLIGKMLKNPLAAKDAEEAGHNVIKSAIEQAGQGGVTTAANNEAIREVVNSNKDSLSGVGESIGSGLASGLAGGAALQSPAAGKAILTRTGKAVADKAAERVAAVMAENAKNSPLRDENIAKTAAEAQAKAPETEATLKDAVAQAHASDAATQEEASYGADVQPTNHGEAMEKIAAQYMKLNTYDPSETQDNPNLPDTLKEKLQGSTTRVEHMQKLADVVNQEGADTADGAHASRELLGNVLDYHKAVASNAEAFNSIPKDHAAHDVKTEFETLGKSVGESDKIKEALTKIQTMKPEDYAKLSTPVTEESVKADPIKAQKDAENIATLAAAHPEKGDLETIKNCLEQAAKKDGIKLTPEQKAALKVSQSVIEAAQKAAKYRDAAGLKTETSAVSDDVLLNDNADNGKTPTVGRSALGFAQRIHAYMSGAVPDVAAAAVELSSMRKFLQSMKNKSEAQNQHYLNGAGGPETRLGYWTRNRDTGKEYQTKGEQRVGVTPTDAKSVDFAQTVHVEATQLADIYNGLSKAYPSLGGKEVTVNDLHPNLRGNPIQVAKDHKAALLAPPEAPVKASITAEQLAKPEITLSRLERQRDRLASLVQEGKATPVEKATLDLINKEIENRNTAADTGANSEPPARSSDEGAAETSTSETATTETEKPVEATPDIAPSNVEGAEDHPEIESRFTPEDAKGLDRDNLKNRIENLKDSPDPEDIATHGVLTAELARRIGVDKKMTDPKTSEDAHPDLFGTKNEGGEAKITNMFHAAFQIAKDKTGALTSRLLSQLDPIAALKKAFDSSEHYASFSDHARVGAIPVAVTRAYRSYLGNMTPLRRIMERALEERMNREIKSGEHAGKTIGEVFASGVDYNRTKDLKLLNLVEQQPDGSFKFNKRIMDQSLIAGMQWLLISDRFAPEMDAAKVTAVTGIPIELASDYVDDLNRKLSDKDAIYSLADMLMDYWGVKKDKDAPKNYADGIAQSMAAELIEAMIQHELLRVEKNLYTDTEHGIPLTEDEASRPAELDEQGNPLPRTFRRADRYVMNLERTVVNEKTGKDTVHPLFRTPTLIDEAVMTDPKNKTFYGENLPPVATHQMNSDIEHTADDKRAIKKANAVIYNLNLGVSHMFSALGLSGMLEIFGAGDLTDRKLNAEDRKSLDGKNTTERTGYEALQTHIEEIKDIIEGQKLAGEEPQELGDVAIHYGHAMSVVERMQQLGGITPQGNKALRAAISAYKSTVDLRHNGQSDAAKVAKTFWTIGLAQALDIPVNALHMDQIEAQLETKLIKFARTVEWMQMAHNGEYLLGHDFISQIKADFEANGIGSKQKHVAFSALSEYARWLNASEEEKANFTTHVYVEADGVTNGPTNALHLFSTGLFDANQIENMKMGGWLPQGEVAHKDIPTTLNERRALKVQQAKDLYEKNSAALQTEMDGEWKRNDDGSGKLSPVQTQIQHTSKLLANLIGGIDVDTVNNTITIGRGIVKNPVTITMYGAGHDGIAGNLTHLMTKAIYTMMSDAAEHLHENPTHTMTEALFDGDKTKAAEFMETLNALLKTTAMRDEGEILIHDNDPAKVKSLTLDDIDPTKFKFDRNQIKSISDNVKTFVVDPLGIAIEKSLGKELMQSLKDVRTSAQAMSIVMQHEFIDRVKEALKAKEGTEGFKKGDFLSQNELDVIQKDMLKTFPLIDTGHQMFQPVKHAQSETVGDTGAALSGKLRSPTRMFTPTDGGVIAQPMLNMGLGDARTIQLMFGLFNSKGLPTFDGFHFGLNDIAKGGRDANQAAFMAWREGNPTRNVLDAYKPFLAALRADPKLLNKPAVRAALGRSILPGVEDPSAKQLLRKLTKMEGVLGSNADIVDRRGQALYGVKANVDTMAGPQTPYEHQGRVLEGATSAEQATALNNIMNESPKGAKGAPAPKEDTQAKSLLNTLLGAGKTLKTGVERFTQASLFRISEALDLTPEQRTIWNSVLEAKGLKGYSVILGSAEAIQSYQGASKLPGRAGTNEVRGFLDAANKRMYLIDPSMETMVHEAIHASSFQAVLAHYMGGELGPNARIVKESVGRLETFMKTFMGKDFRDSIGFDVDTTEAYDTARSAVQEHLDAVLGQDKETDAQHKAAALNEFMAWSLANKDLSNQMKQRTAAPTVASSIEGKSVLGRMSKAVWEEVKALVFGRKGKDMPELGYDMYSNVLFHTQVLIKEQPTTATLNRGVMLAQSRAYGANDRITETSKRFDQLFSKHLKPNGIIDRSRVVEFAQALINTDALTKMAVAQGSGFKMTEQAKNLFENVVTAMSSTMRLDPNAMASAAALYNHVAENLTAKMLEDKGDPSKVHREFVAENKLKVLLGADQKTDANGRSSIMGVFMGLALVDDGFREALSTMKLPKGKKNADGSMDALLGNFANGLMEKGSEQLSGVGKTKNIKDAIDALSTRVSDTSQDAQSTLDVISLAPNTYTNRVNDAFVGWLGPILDRSISKTKDISVKTNSKLVKLLADTATVAAKLATEKNGALIVESAVSLMNKTDNYRTFREVLSAIAGRTDSAGKLTDMVKLGSSMVSQNRQAYRDNLPKMIRDAFDTKPTKEDWAHMHLWARTDIAALRESHSNEEVLKMAADPRLRMPEIRKREYQIRTEDPQYADLIIAKAKQASEYQMTYKAGSNLLRNAEAISKLLLVPGVARNRPLMSRDAVKAIDELTSLYAMNKMPAETQKSIASLVQNNGKGTGFVLDYLVGQRKGETDKATGEARNNAFKGYVPTIREQGTSMVVIKDSDAAPYLAKSYVRMGDYVGSRAEGRGEKMGYYYAPVSGKAAFKQGMMQNATQTSGGVEISTGRSMQLNAGRITNRAVVDRITRSLRQEGNTTENLMPVFGANDRVIAYERAFDPARLDATAETPHLGQALGMWRGRQVEEALGGDFNKSLVDATKDLWDNAGNRKDEFVDLNDPASYGNDQVIKDAISLWTPETKQYIKDTHGDQFMVRRDMLEDTIGARKATIGDMWTGNTRWSPETQMAVRNMAIAAMGNQAYKLLVNAEGIANEVMQEAKSTILVRSMIVPYANFTGNMFQLIGRGISPVVMVRQIPKKMDEAERYGKGRLELMKAEAELRAAEGAKDAPLQLRLNAKIQNINDGFKRLSIWPLIQAGELGTVSHGDMSHEDLALSQGKLHDYISGHVEKLPAGVQAAGRYAVMTKDTAIYQGLQKAVEYGDFLAKAIQYDHWIKRGMEPEVALARISEEYVNYERSNGRTQGYLNDMGLMWFMNYKLRVAKVALSMVRENPVQSLIGMAFPLQHNLPGHIGTPLQDNFVAKTLDGTMRHAFGFGMAMHAPMLHPVSQATGLLLGHM